jgi:ornithine cyclodeaminase/alanine dehydrogenase
VPESEPRFLGRTRVRALLPSIPAQIDLVERTYRAMAAGRVEAPPKIGIHPRPDTFIHAMPAYLADDDVAAIKWVSGYPGNPGQGLPYIEGIIVVNDPATGLVLAVMDAREITAARTAAASGVCIRHWARPGWRTVAILGSGEQGRYHATLVRAINPNAEIRAYDPIVERAATLGAGSVVAPTVEAAVRGADVVVSLAPLVDDPRPVVGSDWLTPEVLLLPADLDAVIGPAAIASTDLLISDDVAQWRYYRDLGRFRGWPEPTASVGEALTTRATAPRVAACNIGSAALDAAFAAAVLRADTGA